MNAEPTGLHVVFVHGLWLHSSGWANWARLYADSGYQVHAPGWPGEADTVEETRAHSAALGNQGVGEATEHYAAYIHRLPSVPIVVGHSFGGLIAQKLLGMGLARACVAISPAQFQGNLRVPLRQLRTAAPVLTRPYLLRKTWAHTKDSFHAGFANGVSRDESDEIFERYVIPAPARPLFQAAVANLVPRSATRVELAVRRGPLLLIAGEADRTVPASAVRAAYHKQRRNPAVTELVTVPHASHSYVLDAEWRTVAELALSFLARHSAFPAQTSADATVLPER
ncbi:MAG: alpha/beta hydrolase [Jatrophihabitantaceae bacterium]